MKLVVNDNLKYFDEINEYDKIRQDVFMPKIANLNINDLEALISYRTAWNECNLGYFCLYSENSSGKYSTPKPVFVKIDGTNIPQFMIIFDMQSRNILLDVPADAFMFADFDLVLGKISITKYVPFQISLTMLSLRMLQCIIICIWELQIQLKFLKSQKANVSN